MSHNKSKMVHTHSETSFVHLSVIVLAYYGAPFIPKLDVEKCTLGLLFGKLTQMAHLIQANITLQNAHDSVTIHVENVLELA